MLCEHAATPPLVGMASAAGEGGGKRRSDGPLCTSRSRPLLLLIPTFFNQPRQGTVGGGPLIESGDRRGGKQIEASGSN